MPRSKRRNPKGGHSSEVKRQKQEYALQRKQSYGTDIGKTDTNTTLTDLKDSNNVDRRSNYSTVFELDNPRFQAYYKAQRFVEEGSDWNDFITSLRQPLPACFRIHPDYPFADDLKRQLLGFAGKKIILEDVNGGTAIEPVEVLKWYPKGNGYKLGTDRRSIRRKEALGDLHKWLMEHTDNGNITRQEAVSMIPPLALDVHPHHKCLDMCAAPGSKTSQLLEIVNRSLASNAPTGQGLVVANDADTDRAYMLVHQCKRISSPLLVVTTHQGQQFPTLTNPPRPEGSHSSKEFFDRVLCDVPCSGDGTLRKNPSIWQKWSTHMGMTMHPLQLMIALRGMQLLKSDGEGLMVYSTCSMSPYENEAVVAELLRAANGSVELIDAREEFLPNFRCRRGLTYWHVLDDAEVIRNNANKKREEKKHKWIEHRKQYRASKEEEERDQMKETMMEEEGGREGTAGGGEEMMKEEEIEEEGMEGREGVDRMEDNEDEKGIEGVAEGVDAEEESHQSMKELRDETLDDIEGEEGMKEGMEEESRPVERLDWTNIPADEMLRDCVRMGMKYLPSHQMLTEQEKRRYRRTLFPPSDEEREWMHLERCLRCVPQDEDTGGFFVATLRKKRKEDKKASSSMHMDLDAVTQPVDISPPLDNATLGAVQPTLPTSTIATGTHQAATETATETATTAATTIATAVAGVGNPKGSTKTNPTGSQKGFVDFQQWDVDAYHQVREFYGVEREAIPPESMFVREDFSLKSQQPKSQQNAGKSKSVYFIPSVARELFQSDTDDRLKVVCAGVKMFERKITSNGQVDYRLLQEGVSYFAPHISKRKVQVTIQDFCNLLGGGLVSYRTLSPGMTLACHSMVAGVVICYYEFSVTDILPLEMIQPTVETTRPIESSSSVSSKRMDEESIDCKKEVVVAIVGSSESGLSVDQSARSHTFYLVCWKGSSSSLNVMCGKTDIQSIRHQLSSLKVLRPKIASQKMEMKNTD